MSASTSAWSLASSPFTTPEMLSGCGAASKGESLDRDAGGRHRAKRDADEVRLDARPAGIAADGGHRSVLAVLFGGLRHAPLPDDLHGLIVGRQGADAITSRPRVTRRADLPPRASVARSAGARRACRGDRWTRARPRPIPRSRPRR